MNAEFIADEIKHAMRERDKPRLSILRLVKNEIDTKQKESGEPLSDEEVVATAKKVLKQTAETLEASEKAGTDDARTALLRQQVAILEGYLPEQVTGDELAALVDQVLSEHDITQKRDMGRAIGLVAAEAGGNVDKAEVARLLGPRLA